MNSRTGSTMTTAQTRAATIIDAGSGRAGSGLAEGIGAVAIEGRDGGKTEAGNVRDELRIDVEADPWEDEAQQADGDDPGHDE
jgi:hypothetical protein